MHHKTNGRSPLQRPTRGRFFSECFAATGQWCRSHYARSIINAGGSWRERWLRRRRNGRRRVAALVG